jgi:O-antigen chain-terminating methyltransferase
MDERDRLDRERRDADTRYNDALTALDRIVVAASGRERSREDFDRTATALLQFLQQITAFVESKDRQMAGDLGTRIEMVGRGLEPVEELRTQVGVLRRAMDALKRTLASPQSEIANPQSEVGTPQSTIRNPQSEVGTPHSAIRNPQSSADDFKYVGFEDLFRGSDEAIEERLRSYVPIFAASADVLDIGCGRGELLSALKAAGVRARGIDANAEMVAIARERGLDASHADALQYLTSLPDGSLGGVIATQVVEHLEPPYLMRLLDAAARALRPGAPIVLETINPACWLAFFSSYIRDITHVRPVHPETLQYLLRASAFERVSIRYSAPVPEHMKMKTVDLPDAVLAATDPSAAALTGLAHVVNANAVILNNLMFTHLDYAAIGFRS